MKAIAESKVIGDQFLASNTGGAITKPNQFRKVLDYIQTGVKEGARLVCGGKRIGTVGHFVEPTIFADVEDNMMIAKEEVIYIEFIVSEFLLCIVSITQFFLFF